MSNNVTNSLDMAHPILRELCNKINAQVIAKHNAPFKLFETGRTHERHQSLISKGRTQNIFSKHLYYLDGETPMYSIAVDYVFYDGKWSWNLRNQTVLSWYLLFGNLVLDCCSELQWGGNFRKTTNYTHFQLKEDVVLENIDTYPCILHLS
jgi:hypothetical protein